MTRTEDLLPTRKSLISRLRNCEDQEGWRDFFQTYWKLIYGFAVGRNAKIKPPSHQPHQGCEV